MRVAVVVALAALALALRAAANANARITPACNGILNACSTGWYTTNVVVSFQVSGTVVSGCTPVTISVDQNVPALGNQPHCEVSNGSSQTTTLYVPIKRDATPPSATEITPQRAPDTNGWYNRALGVTVAGTDVTSGIASCTSVTYSGPDAGSAA